MGNKSFEDAWDHVFQGQKEKSSPTPNNHCVDQSIKVGQLYMLIEKQKQLIEELSLKVNGLETIIKNEINVSHDILLKRIEQIDTFLQSMRPENTHRAMLEFLQKLNKYIDDEKIDREFAANIREYISSVLNTYRYRIVDYSDETSYAYEEEICSVPSPELVRRAIIDNKGNVILKGKVYINK